MKLARQINEAATGRRRDDRGIALLIALIMVVLITAFVTEFNYASRVKIMSASHARDDLRAEFLAKSGVRIYGLLLTFGKQVAGNQFVGQMLETVGLSMDGPAMFCRSMPFLDTGMLRFLAGSEGMSSDEQEAGLMETLGFGGDEDREGAGPAIVRGALDETGEDAPTLRRGLLEFEGDFKVECKDESAQVDLNGFAEARWAGLALQQHPVAMMLYGLMAPEEYDPLFEERLKMDRWELIGNIKDWVDGDTQRSGTWGGDEDALYDDEEPRYRAKNSRFDTLEELRLVAGVDDEVFETFGSQLSIFSRQAKVNVASAEARVLEALVRGFSDPGLVTDQQVRLAVQQIVVQRMFMPIGNAQQFIDQVKATGITFIPEAEQELRRIIVVDSSAFRLSSTGYLNDSTAHIEATVRINRNGVRYLNWKER